MTHLTQDAISGSKVKLKTVVMKQNNELRKRIEDVIGQELFNRLGDNESGPIMIPPIPESKFIDKLPEGELDDDNLREKNHQESYEAEVRLYRCFEEIKT